MRVCAGSAAPMINWMLPLSKSAKKVRSKRSLPIAAGAPVATMPWNPCGLRKKILSAARISE